MKPLLKRLTSTSPMGNLTLAYLSIFVTLYLTNKLNVNRNQRVLQAMIQTKIVFVFIRLVFDIEKVNFARSWFFPGRVHSSSEFGTLRISSDGQIASTQQLFQTNSNVR
jgi:hypothetical protein